MFCQGSFINDVTQSGGGGWSFCDKHIRLRAWECDTGERGSEILQIWVTSFMNDPLFNLLNVKPFFEADTKDFVYQRFSVLPQLVHYIFWGQGFKPCKTLRPYQGVRYLKVIATTQLCHFIAFDIAQTVGIWIPDYSGIQMVKVCPIIEWCLICTASEDQTGIQMIVSFSPFTIWIPE